MIDLLSVATMGFYTSGQQDVTLGGTIVVSDDLDIEFDTEYSVPLSFAQDEVIDIEVDPSEEVAVETAQSSVGVSVKVTPVSNITITPKAC